MLLTVFMAYYAIISVYAHVHVVNGVMVVHSHPFKDKHSHPTGQTLVLHHLTHFNSLEAGPAAEIEAPGVKLIHTCYSEYAVAHATPDYNSGIYLRALPFLHFHKSFYPEFGRWHSVGFLFCIGLTDVLLFAGMVNYACEKADCMTATRKRKYGRQGYILRH